MCCIETQGLCKCYDRLVAVRDVNLRIRSGLIVGLVGANGAGKSTLLRMLATAISPTNGRATVLGCDLEGQRHAIRARIGYLPDFFNLYATLTTVECLRYFALCYGIAEAAIPDKIEQTLQEVDLIDKRDQRIASLSRGMVQRLGLATLLVRDPRLLILDEPASGLDQQQRTKLFTVLGAMTRDNTTVLISSHIMPEMTAFCDRIIRIDHGVIEAECDDPMSEAQPERQRRLIIDCYHGLDQALAMLTQDSRFVLVTRQDRRLELNTVVGDRDIAALHARLISVGVAILSFRLDEVAI